MNNSIKKLFTKNIIIEKFYTKIPVCFFYNFSALLLIIADGVIVGHSYKTSDALNAINLVSPITVLLGAFVQLPASGLSFTCSKAIGKGDKTKYHRYVKGGIILTFLLMGIFIATIPALSYGALCLYPINENLLNMAIEYYSGTGLGVVIGTISTVGTYLLICLGRTKTLIKLSFIECFCKILVTYTIVRIFNGGLAGAGWSNFITNSVRCLLTIWFLRYEIKSGLKIKGSIFKEIKEIIKHGAPSMLSFLTSPVQTYITNFILLRYLGDDGILVKSVGFYAVNMSLIFVNSVIQAANPFLGLSSTLKDWSLTNSLLKNIIVIVVAFTSIYSFVSFVKPEWFFYLFGEMNPSVQCFRYFLAFSFFFVFTGLNKAIFNILIYYNKKLVSTIIDFSTSVVYFMILLVIYALHDTNKLFFSYPMSAATETLLFILLILGIINKDSKKNNLKTWIFNYKFGTTSELLLNFDKSVILSDINSKFYYKIKPTILKCFAHIKPKPRCSLTVRTGIVQDGSDVIFYLFDNGAKCENLKFESKDTADKDIKITYQSFQKLNYYKISTTDKTLINSK